MTTLKAESLKACANALRTIGFTKKLGISSSLATARTPGAGSG
ncbi:hypothetical protein [Longispora albida]|nr:hypothetical protein [Longispora albida]